jgi:hypothetical protein
MPRNANGTFQNDVTYLPTVVLAYCCVLDDACVLVAQNFPSNIHLECLKLALPDLRIVGVVEKEGDESSNPNA